MQTVVGRAVDGGLAMRGVFIGDDARVLRPRRRAEPQSEFRNGGEALEKAVVYLDPQEFHSTWLGNKAVYRTRMALADGAELIILAPAVKRIWRGSHHRRADPQVWVSRDAGDAGCGRKECRSGRRSKRGGASDSRLVGGPLHHYVVSGTSDTGGSGGGWICVRGPE